VHRRLSTIALTTLSFAFASAALAADGVKVTSRQTSGGETTTDQIQFDKDHLRSDSVGANGTVTRTFIFDGTKQVMFQVEPESKTYTEITKDDMQRISAQMSQLSAQMQERLKNLPPERRAQMEQMMRGRGMAASSGNKPEYKKTGSDHVGKWACDVYERTDNGAKEDEVCAAGAAALGLTAADLNVLTEMQALVKGALPPALADRSFAIGNAEVQGFPGFPLRRVHFSNGHETSRTEVVDVTRQSIAASAFEVPAGYQKKPFMER
jgi:Domain of unknown function (DUF4412)